MLKKINSNLTRWIPAIKKIARDRGVIVDDELCIEIIEAADVIFKAEYGECFDKDKWFAYSIKRVFENRLVLMERDVKSRKNTFVSEWVKPKSKIVYQKYFE
jgi:hypothetical protein